MRLSIGIGTFAIVCVTLGCDPATSTASGPDSKVSSSSIGDRREVSLAGTSAHAEVAGDKIELKDGAVYVNGVSFGPVAPGETIRYVVTPIQRELRVGDELRKAQK